MLSRRFHCRPREAETPGFAGRTDPDISPTSGTSRLFRTLVDGADPVFGIPRAEWSGRKGLVGGFSCAGRCCEVPWNPTGLPPFVTHQGEPVSGGYGLGALPPVRSLPAAGLRNRRKAYEQNALQRTRDEILASGCLGPHCICSWSTVRPLA